MSQVIERQMVANVVSDDIAELNTTARATAEAKTVGGVLLSLEARRVMWESAEYRTSNQVLYGMLAECLGFAGEMTTADAKVRNAEIEKLYKERGYKLRADTPLITRIVRLVFGDRDRSRINTYSLVLREAQRRNIGPLDLAEWIEAEGGLQSIRLGRGANYVKPSERVAVAKNSFDSLPVLAVAKSEEFSLLADAEFVGTECVLLAQQQADGSFAVRALIRSGGAVSAAYAALYSQNKLALTAARLEIDSANDADGMGKVAA